MTTSSQPNLTQQELDKLQQLRASLFSFQYMIGSLPADGHSNAENEQFNRWHLEAKTLLKDNNLEKKAAIATTSDMLTRREQKRNGRLLFIVVMGVILALIGLGINSIILEELITNSIACLVSTIGMLLIIVAFNITFLGRGRRKRKLTTLGDLYAQSETLLQQIDNALSKHIPNYASRPVAKMPENSSVVALTLDSLNKQKVDWTEKLNKLQEQHNLLGQGVPMELIANIDFIKREINRIEYEITGLGKKVNLHVIPPLVEEKQAISTFSKESRSRIKTPKSIPVKIINKPPPPEKATTDDTP